MGRIRKIESPELMERLWDEYSEYCNNYSVEVHEFSQKLAMFVTQKLRKPITVTIEGFCSYIGLARSAFYESYDKNEEYSDIVTRMREECENDARRKFETGVIPHQLSHLWMSKHGYSTNEKVESVNKNIEIVIGDDDFDD